VPCPRNHPGGLADLAGDAEVDQGDVNRSSRRPKVAGVDGRRGTKPMARGVCGGGLRTRRFVIARTRARGSTTLARGNAAREARASRSGRGGSSNLRRIFPRACERRGAMYGRFAGRCSPRTARTDVSGDGAAGVVRRCSRVNCDRALLRCGTRCVCRPLERDGRHRPRRARQIFAETTDRDQRLEARQAPNDSVIWHGAGQLYRCTGSSSRRRRFAAQRFLGKPCAAQTIPCSRIRLHLTCKDGALPRNCLIGERHRN